MKYNFTSTGTYRLSISSKAIQDERFSLKIDRGIKSPVSSIPVAGYDNIAYIKEGQLSLTTEQEGGKIFYTTDGTNPAMEDRMTGLVNISDKGHVRIIALNRPQHLLVVIDDNDVWQFHFCFVLEFHDSFE